MKASTLDPRLDERLSDAERRFEGVEEALASPEVLSDPDKLRELGQERAHLEPIVATGRKLREALKEHAGAVELAEEAEDPEMRALAEEEADTLSGRIESLTKEAKELLIPPDPLADRPAVVEIRAGTGGDEAGLFAADLMRMYRSYAERQGWSMELMSLSEGIPGSIKEAIFTLRGRGVYGR
ncbi:MAG: PCRF domain-containing protein, partial [Longimicrobiales bacterium]|nr:PCRF domain-containing protein [Longimicrobiales bacterium]